MNKTGVIMQLADRLNITEEQAAQVDEIIEAHPIIGKKAEFVLADPDISNADDMEYLTSVAVN